jgi:hypothetical protein
MASNDATVDAFFAVFASGSSPSVMVNTLMTTVFCPQNNTVPPTMPAVGITGHGPNFHGAESGPPPLGVTLLFTQLLTSFPDLQFTELNKKRRLYSVAGTSPVTIIGTQATLQGTYQKPWFPKTADSDAVSHYSKPLSDIPAFGSPATPKATKPIPAFTLFEFGSTTAFTVSRLLIYLDRYSFIRDLYQTAEALTLTSTTSQYHEHERHH